MEVELRAEQMAFGIFGHTRDASGMIVFLVRVEGFPDDILPGDIFNA